jgi:ketosteroid isomerase-like protein
MRTILFIMLAASVAGCNSTSTSNAPAATNFNLDSVKAHITEMNKSYGRRFTTNDPAFYKERYCKDAAVYSPNIPAVVGIDSIISFFYVGGNNNEAIIELPPNNIYGNADLVVEDGTYNFPDGKGGSVDKGKFIALWKQEDGKWKLYREIWNTDLPPGR